MKIAKRDAELIKQIALRVGGDLGYEIAEELVTRGSITDDDLSGMYPDANEARGVLYILQSLQIVNLVYYRMKKSRWMVYEWRINYDRLDSVLRDRKKKVYEVLKHRLEYERANPRYWCGTLGCKSYSFDEAFEYLFKCPYCGRQLKLIDNKKLLKFLENLVKKLEKDLQR